MFVIWLERFNIVIVGSNIFNTKYQNFVLAVWSYHRVIGCDDFIRVNGGLEPLERANLEQHISFAVFFRANEDLIIILFDKDMREWREGAAGAVTTDEIVFEIDWIQNISLL